VAVLFTEFTAHCGQYKPWEQTKRSSLLDQVTHVYCEDFILADLGQPNPGPTDDTTRTADTTTLGSIVSLWPKRATVSAPIQRPRRTVNRIGRDSPEQQR